MNELALVKSAEFGNIQCDFYSDGSDFWMTREQVGTALEYGDPARAIGKLHSRRKERLDKFSAVVKLTTTDGKAYDTTVYNRKGIMEICRHSDQPKADDFMDFCWEVMDSLAKGEMILVGVTDYQRESLHFQKAELLNQIAGEYDGTYKQILQAYATKELTGEFILPLPALERKTYSAKEIGELLGVSANKIGTLTNKNGLKTEAYGKWFVDKSPHSSKEVQSFRYYDSVIPVLRGLI